MTAPVKSAPEQAEENIHVHFDTRPPELSRGRRMQIPLIAWAVYWAIRLIGPTMRFEVLGWPNVQSNYGAGKRCILAFWHRSIFSATWWWRNSGIMVMNTTNFDGQWTRRVIERLGFRTAQGSSSRGGLRALAAMAQYLEKGSDVAFTIDGTRGPRYVA
ncbi:MAG: lysophospholipid acyltransferase family protein, partial [Candidatus Acidiferrales bacterium]